MTDTAPRNLAQLFYQTVQRYPDKKGLMFKAGSSYTALTWNEVFLKVRSVAASFAQKGLQKGDRLAIFSENCPEWVITDLAAQCLGLVTVPIYTSLSPSEAEYILTDCGAKAVAVSNKALFEKIAAVQKKIPNLQWVLGFDAALTVSKDSLTVPFYLLRDFQKADATGSIENLFSLIQSDDVASIIYTSGTTGQPKGVMLTQANFIHNVIGCRDTLRMGESDIHLSFLPLSHVFERTAGYYLMVHIGATIAYAESMDTVSKNIGEVRPTFLLGVPRFYEKIRTKVLDSMNSAPPLRRRIFFWAKELGEERRLGKSFTGFKRRIQYRIANRLVFKKFRQRLGGRLRFCISGGAPISKEIVEFFADLGVMIYEGYGLTETSPVISVNREGKFKIGTVGIPLAGVQVRICEDGEIATKSPSVMKGYYHKPAETEAVLKDGWFYTGDLGRLDRDGFLAITGRKKELIVTSGGKKVTPRPIEELLERDPYILRCVLFGEGKKFITALIVPREDTLLKYAQDNKISFDSYAELVKDEKIYQFFDARIHGLMTDFASFESIKYFALLPQDFSQEAGELTPTLKVKREVVFTKHKDLLLPFYEKNTPE